MSSVPVHVLVDGADDAPVVVLSNSLGSDLTMWDPQISALQRRFRVVRYDIRGHGASPVPSGPYRIDDLADDVVALLDRLGVQRASFCGLSLGGMTGLQLAATAAERVERLVLLCTSVRLPPAQGWHDRAALVRAQGTEAVSAAVVDRWFTPEFAAREPELVTHMRAMVAATPAEGYAGCCEAIAELDLTWTLPRITAPTLVIAGADDPATPPPHAQAITDGIAGSRMQVLPQAAHLANVEQSEAVGLLLLDHLGADGAAGGPR